MFTITRDLIWEGPPADNRDRPATGLQVDEMPLYAMERIVMRAEGLDNKLPSGLTLIPFKLYDDDGECYYHGVLDDDEDCTNQSAALRWGETMAGCTTIKVKRDGKLVQEIG